jgi:hypothetical protein
MKIVLDRGWHPCSVSGQQVKYANIRYVEHNGETFGMIYTTAGTWRRFEEYEKWKPGDKWTHIPSVVNEMPQEVQRQSEPRDHE